MFIKAALKKILPASFLAYRQRKIVARIREGNRHLSAKEVFTTVYESNAWGGAKGEYCSGNGSADHYADSYAMVINEFITTHNVKSVIDLGCGDFNVGKRLLQPSLQYIGIDVVDELIQRNRVQYGTENVSFQCLDIAHDELPDGELCLIRQVLQHCSNDEIISILDKAKKYKWLIITEHYPSESENIIANLDKPHGADTRVVNGSAVYLDYPPFDVRGLTLLLEIPYTDSPSQGETLRTYKVEGLQLQDF